MLSLFGKNKTPFDSIFSSNAFYLEEIESIQAKRVLTAPAHEQDARSTFTTISLKRGTFVRLLRKSLRDGTYRPGFVKLVTIKRKGKKRTIYQFPIVDRILHGVLARVLLQEMGPGLSPHLYSYRKDQNWSTAVQNFTEYVRSHRKQIANPRERGLYVLRADVKSYAETIPVGSGSLLWEQLSALVDRAGDFKPAVLELLRMAIRPEILSDEGNSYMPLVGIPFGSPISTVLFNLYLKDLDFELQSLNKNAFYARYGDDILYAHPSLEVVQEFERKLIGKLRGRKLELCRKKHSLNYFNGAGRRDPENPHIRGAHSLTFLGVRVAFDGTTGLKMREVRRILREVQERIKNHNQLHKPLPLQQRAHKICSLVNDIFDPRLPHSTYCADMLQKCISDRKLFKSLDLEIANIAAETISGRRGKRAFDTVSYTALRNQYGLKSLSVARNRYEETCS